MKKLLMAAVVMMAAMVSILAADPVWNTDITKALAQAKETKRPVMLVISGSDWCPPCMALEKNVLSDKKFQKFAAENLILVQADFPRKKKQAEAVAKLAKAAKAQYAPNDGFPTVVLIGADGKAIGKQVGYSGVNAEKYIEQLKGTLKK